jgi:hypothetical protein
MPLQSEEIGAGICSTCSARKQSRELAHAELLAARAVACKGWRWMPGMLTTGSKTTSEGGRVLRWDADFGGDVGYRDGTAAHLVTYSLPDLDDPATLGCLLTLVREAWGISAEGSFTLTHVEGRHAWTSISDSRGKALFYVNASPEAERLVAALEAAP